MLSRISACWRLCAIVLVASPVLVASSARGAEPLVWKWQKGDAARYLMTQSMGMTIQAGAGGQAETSMQQDMLMDWAVEDVSEDGAAVVEQRVERIVMQNKAGAGQEFKYDSDSEDPPAGMAALVAPAFDAMVAHPFQMTMLPTGEITEVTLSDELSKALDNLPGGAVSSDMIKQMSQQASLKFPTEPLAVGDKWTTTAEVTSPAIGKMKVHTTYTYDGVREVDGKTYEAFTPAIEMELGENKGPMAIDFDTKESTGEILFDREKGRVFRSRVLQTVDIRVKMGENEIVNSMKQAVEMRELGKDETPTLGAPAEEEAEVDTETDSEATPTEEPAATE
ncbi:hypothetical protein K2D_30780 [Planctomycetes bacterium K2D]|nr:hypothetical protein K2D_30780 [Planctomycetes bacterium K2D]